MVHGDFCYVTYAFVVEKKIQVNADKGMANQIPEEQVQAYGAIIGTAAATCNLWSTALFGFGAVKSSVFMVVDQLNLEGISVPCSISVRPDTIA